MDGFLRALGFESKPEFTDKIPDNLTKDCFNVQNVRDRVVDKSTMSLCTCVCGPSGYVLNNLS